MIRIYLQKFEQEAGKKKYETEHQAGIKLLDRAVREVFGAECYRCERTLEGKPWISSPPGIEFNISHSHSLAVCAIGQIPLGVDVEQIRPYREPLLGKILSEKERKMFLGDNMSRAEKEQLFFRLWTLKESYVKAVGCGIRVPLSEISFSFDGKEIQCSKKGFGFWQRQWEERYLISLCWQGESREQVVVMTAGNS